MANFLVGFLNLIIKAFGSILKFVLSILPTSPFIIIEDIEIPYLNYLNWILPIDLFLSILGYWLSAIGIYYIVSVVLRWVKAIE